MAHKRKRGTAIVETSKGILVTSGHKNIPYHKINY